MMGYLQTIVKSTKWFLYKCVCISSNRKQIQVKSFTFDKELVLIPQSKKSALWTLMKLKVSYFKSLIFFFMVRLNVLFLEKVAGHICKRKTDYNQPMCLVEPQYTIYIKCLRKVHKDKSATICKRNKRIW